MEMFKNNIPQLKGHYELQPYRIQEILLVSNLYDAFIFEEDGQLTERIFNEYMDLHLHYAPRITQVSSAERAFEMLRRKKYDLIISTLQTEEIDLIDFCRKVKKRYPRISTVLLIHAPSRLPYLKRLELQKSFDRIFSWSGDTKIFLAIIKLIEDRLNVEHDTKIANVRIILVVEDSIKQYSSFLPLLYSEIMNQTKSLMSLSLNQDKRIFRMRARPKVLLANNYEDAVKICEKYKNHLIGIISDIKFSKNGQPDPEAGFTLIQKAKKLIPDLPAILHSSEPNNREQAHRMGAVFLDKNSPILLQELGNFMREHLGFGDFIFKTADGNIVDRATNLLDLEEKLKTISDESLLYHTQRNHFSIWLMARGEFILANELRPRQVKDFESTEALRQVLIKALSDNRYKSQQGIIVDFLPERFDPGFNFIRIGGGSLGGKARGIAFVSSLLAQPDLNKLKNKFNNVEISVPYSAVVGTDEFDRFMKDNKLARIAIKGKNDEKIAEAFLKAEISVELHENLFTLLKHINYPIAVRSSSLLEDSHSQPFAGIYATYMLPNNHPKIDVRLKQLSDAIKLIYASTYYQPAKAYLKATSNRIEEEKMGVIIQQVAGKQYDDLFYPDFSGVIRSINFFPVSHMKHEDGIAYVALGLGNSIVEGQNVLQFSPKHPEILPQLTTTSSALKNTQKTFYALNMSDTDIQLLWNEDVTLRQENLARAEADGTLNALGSVYEAENDRLRDGIYNKGPRIVSFSHILKSEVFPLADLLIDILELGKVGLGNPVEIEFAVELAKNKEEKHKFHFLQIRPMISDKEQENVDISDIPRKKILCNSHHSLGNGIIRDITSIVYVRPNEFDPATTNQIAEELGKINEALDSNALFIGLGRWGTADPWLGIPVNWAQISKARIIVEVSLDKFNIDPSHGSHFFHNITSLGLGYFTIPANSYEEFVDWDWLESQVAKYENKLVRHIELSSPIEVILNGRKGTGTILKTP